MLCTPSNPDVYILPLIYAYLNYDAANSQLGIYLTKFGADSFVRALPGSIHSFDPETPYDSAEERVIYVAKDVAANMYDSIHSIRRSAIQFYLPKKNRIKQVYPESLWDSSCSLFLVPSPIISVEQCTYPNQRNGHTEFIFPVTDGETNPPLPYCAFFIAQKPIGIIFSWDGEKDNELSYIMANAHNLKFEELYKEHSSVLELKKDVHLNSVTSKLTEGMTDTAPRFHIDIRPDSSSDLCNIM